MTRLWQSIPSEFHPAITGTLLFIAFAIVAFSVSILIERLSKKTKKPIIKLLKKLTRNSILLIGLISALGTAGINVTALIASLGLIGFAAGYALKDFLSNTIAGFMLMFNSTIKKNDKITVGNFSGTVIDINLRYTILRDEDKRYFIPNSTLFTNTLTLFDNGEH